jgi:hypothetical protein
VKRVGYSPQRAAWLKEQISRDAMRIEARMATMVSRVTDISPGSWEGEGPDNVLERVRQIEHDLHAIIDRRTQA